MSKDKEIVGITRLYMTIKKIRINGLYEDGTEFQLAIDRDSKANRKAFAMADDFVKQLYKSIEDA